MTAFEMAMRPLRKYADFKGRASRSEFWTFFVFVLIVQAVARIVDLLFWRWASARRLLDACRRAFVRAATGGDDPSPA